MPELTIPEETYARLSAWAASRDQTVEEAVTPVLDSLAPVTPTPEERAQAHVELKRLARSRADRYPSGYRADDSRESIYEGCGE